MKHVHGRTEEMKMKETEKDEAAAEMQVVAEVRVDKKTEQRNPGEIEKRVKSECCSINKSGQRGRNRNRRRRER